MDWAVRLLKSSIGAKVLMAVTGAILSGFVVGHMAGNLLIFAGPEALNDYAFGLKNTPLLLWGTRFTLLAAVTVHVLTAFKLYMGNNDARPVKYAYNGKKKATTIQSSTMIISGAMLLAFIVYHLLHFTLGVVDSGNYADQHIWRTTADGEQIVNVYFMVVKGFSNPLISGSYIIAMVLLGSHLSHGISSLFQSLGANNTRLRPHLQKIGYAVATIVTLGNISMPLAVLTNILKLPAGA